MRISDWSSDVCSSDLIAATKAKGAPVNILTHCNAGWLATVDWGTATAPMYLAFEEGIPLHVWADETRPRNQGASLTAWELGRHGVPHTVIADHVGGPLMQPRSEEHTAELQQLQRQQLAVI